MIVPRFTTTHQKSRRVKYGLFDFQPERSTDRSLWCGSANGNLVVTEQYTLTYSIVKVEE
ncbi:unnamed protein product [Brassica oleracea]